MSDAASSISPAGVAPPNFAPPPLPVPLAAVDESERFLGLDAIRGFALLGIFLVNIQSFVAPFGPFMDPQPLDWSNPAEAFAQWAVYFFCFGKFYPLFSFLFGLGMALQFAKSARTGSSSMPHLLRRQGILFCIGLFHALVLWYGDILFLYAIFGTLLLLFRNLKPRTLLAIAAASALVSISCTGGMGMLQSYGERFEAQLDASKQTQPAPAPAASETQAPAAGEPDATAAPKPESPAEPAPAPDSSATTPDATPEADAALSSTDDSEKSFGEAAPTASYFDRLMNGISTGTVSDPNSPGWIKFETEAFRDGPFLSAFIFRAMMWGFMVLFAFFGFGWHILAMFLLGAALGKLGILLPERRHWLKRLVMFGFAAGIPITIISTSMSFSSDKDLGLAGTTVNMIGGPCLALAYFGTVVLLATGPLAGTPARLLSNVGRLGLTNYLSQTLIATFIAYHWGLRMFGEINHVERIGLVLVIYAAQIALSALYLKFFRIGPMEWLWRSLTYLKPQALLRK
jgi:uncharacterized protein